MRYFGVFISFCLILCLNSVQAQISFVNGNVLNLNSSKEMMYLETQILFHTGKYKSDDYRWEKVSENIDSKWFVTACFNGDCKNELLQNGTFLRDFGLNDTTCFIAFHVETFFHNGSSVIKYKVYNNKNLDDSALMTFNITYSGLGEVYNSSIVPIEIVNPVHDVIRILSLNSKIEDLKIYDIQGRVVYSFQSPDISGQVLSIPIPEGLSGICFLQLRSDGQLVRKKIIIEN